MHTSYSELSGHSYMEPGIVREVLYRAVNKYARILRMSDGFLFIASRTYSMWLLSSLRKRDLTTCCGISSPLMRMVGAVEQTA